MSRRLPVLVAAAVLLSPLAAHARTTAPAVPTAPYDCTGPAPEAEPGTPEWTARELGEAACGEQRAADTATNPLFLARAVTANGAATAAAGSLQAADPFRDPAEHDGSRFRWRTVSFTEESGQRLPGHLYLPCDSTCTDVPPGLARHRPPYPAVVVVHGGAARQEMYWWAAQGLAEAGYAVLTFQVPTRENTGSGAHPADTRAALDYLLATPSAPSPAGEHDPAWAQVDRTRVGLAGHSAGGVAANLVGQQDPRVDAIVSWDRAQSTQMPEELVLRTPALFVVADYNCQQVPVCLPQPYSERPDPLGPGNKDRDFQRLRAAGVDTMKVALRAATHLDFTELVPGLGSRYGTAVTAHYTRAWFDRYLRGTGPGRQRLAQAARARLVAGVFDGSTDVHSTSGGRFDPLTASNVPPVLRGMPVADRLSHHFRSGYWLEGGRLACEDVRNGCG